MELPLDTAPLSFRERFSRYSLYLYFLRFCILTWLFLPLLICADWFTGVAALTRGILTVDSGWQAVYAAFFVIALNMTVLVTTRNIVLNGKDRFEMHAPPWLERRLAAKSPAEVWGLLLFIHLPSLFTLWYLGVTAGAEQEQFRILGVRHGWVVWVFLAIGAFAGLVFWYLVSLFYYWSYKPSELRPTPSTLIFPLRMFGNTAYAARPRVSEWLHWSTCHALRVSYPGYAEAHTGPLWELHYLSTLALVGFLLLYLFLCPLTAPTSVSRFAWFCIALQVVLVAVFLYGLTGARLDQRDEADEHGNCKANPSLVVKDLFALERKLVWFFGGLAIFMSGSISWFLYDDISSNSVKLEMAFPTLASILVMVTFSLWFLAGASFFFDRYRIPVLTAVLLFIFVPKWLPVNMEHYYSVHQLAGPVIAPLPDEVVKLRVKHPDEPYIIVTAAGGGIQAAEWTSEVMSELEHAFATDTTLNPVGDAPHYTLHDHLLLASGVSGGSVGLMPYLLEYTANGDVGMFQDRARLINPPACSSLEAVSWGLAYYDLFRAIFTVPFPHEGDESHAPDRTWALTTSFNRNLNDRHCHIHEEQKEEKKPYTLPPPPIMNGEDFTLAHGVKMIRAGAMPAFTMNTTAAETGGRFLLSDYQVPQATNPKSDFLPAESFLQAYAQDTPCLKPKAYADMSLATAARLSATFPYVSSGTRIPRRFADHAYHFLDGGYYDNDGTASVIEFLMGAFGPSTNAGPVQATVTANGSGPCQPGAVSPVAVEAPKVVVAGAAAGAAPKKLKILLVEIRDGADLNATTNEDDYAHQDGVGAAKEPKGWKSLSQILGPGQALWNAGHVSVTRRNRIGLCLLEQAYKDRLELHHLVFTIDPNGDKTSPLSWHLTAGQRKYIDDWTKNVDPKLKKDNTQKTMHEAVDWVKAVMPSKDGKVTVQETTEACQTS